MQEAKKYLDLVKRRKAQAELYLEDQLSSLKKY